MTPALAGFGLGLSLIVAIGAQNVFVLRQGLRREKVALVVAICALSDAALIAAGTAGFGAAVAAAPALLTAAKWGGAAFLAAYGLLAARRAWRPKQGLTAGAAEAVPASTWRVAITCLALTWLNPHVYLDTVVLLGSVASSHGDAAWLFAAGAGVGSVVWFAALGFGARLLSGLLAKPGAWRVLDAAVAVVMIALAVGLLIGS